MSDRVSLSPEELSKLLDDAAERGAERALRRVGLDDEASLRDWQELRSLLEVWRATKRTAWHTIVKLLTGAILSAITIGIALKLKLFAAS